ncbi:MAG: hypothetical protein U1E58_10210 [Tabrizicola sp.]
MTDYLPYVASEYAVDSPATALHFERWFRNWEAGFEGAPGAPRVLFAALDDAFKTAGGVGTYVFARRATDANFGDNVAGSSLTPTSGAMSVPVSSGTAATFNQGAALSGTWKCMGTMDAAATFGGGGSMLGATLWLRIA